MSKVNLCEHQNVERRTFDPEVLNLTLKNIQKSIDVHTKDTVERFKEIKESINEIKKDNKVKTEKIIKVDKEFSICRAGNKGVNTQKATTLQVLSIIIACFAAVFTGLKYLKG